MARRKVEVRAKFARYLDRSLNVDITVESGSPASHFLIWAKGMRFRDVKNMLLRVATMAPSVKMLPALAFPGWRFTPWRIAKTTRFGEWNYVLGQGGGKKIAFAVRGDITISHIVEGLKTATVGGVTHTVPGILYCERWERIRPTITPPKLRPKLYIVHITNVVTRESYETTASSIEEVEHMVKDLAKRLPYTPVITHQFAGFDVWQVGPFEVSATPRGVRG